MEVHDESTDELSGDGILIVAGKSAGVVSYFLTLAPEAGPLIAEGSISGSEALLSNLKKHSKVELALEDGPVVPLRCDGGHGGIRWVKVVKA